jgi:hypothetical protein
MNDDEWSCSNAPIGFGFHPSLCCSMLLSFQNKPKGPILSLATRFEADWSSERCVWGVGQASRDKQPISCLGHMTYEYHWILKQYLLLWFLWYSELDIFVASACDCDCLICRSAICTVCWTASAISNSLKAMNVNIWIYRWAHDCGQEKAGTNMVQKIQNRQM